MSDSYDSSESSDEIANELSIEQDRAINIALAKTITGEALKNEEISIDSEYKESHSKEEKSKLLNENKEALDLIRSAHPEDETDAFLLDYFSSRKWEEKQKKPSAEELKADDDLEEIDDGLEFEERYNFRHQEENFDVIPTNPRYIEGEDRVRETNRHKKRREAAEKSKEQEEIYNKRLDDIDEKYRKIAEQNGGRLTSEQLHEYTNECADVLLEEQGDSFNYSEVKVDGGIEKSVRILEGNDEEESENESNDDDNDNDREPNSIKKKEDKKWDKKQHKFNKKGHGRFDKNRKNRFRGVSASRMSAFESHKH